MREMERRYANDPDGLKKALDDMAEEEAEMEAEEGPRFPGAYLWHKFLEHRKWREAEMVGWKVREVMTAYEVYLLEWRYGKHKAVEGASW